ncbi:hypothetical protein I6A60_31315 [Frankia sp. AgB1.9]|uniref:hypothetical protein n=1 Tax=unclassified Frankia TaxID=2632575 RepID=UPI00193278A5|nr:MULTISPECIES: hypothetical protein [unclassified Frankia]MBL7493881.1 hypothetical protein [Frankia sp. AgW1.1]MBL7552320.1 hypothetical protein [Frankia sp. AgB1.9]MBL7622073.1 hypothetical protein [Frankia sp. AgB1.8]
MTEEPRLLRAVVGESVRRIRELHGARQDDVSRTARLYGLAWSRSKVAELERGEKPVSIEELALLPRILTDLAGADMIGTVDLVPSNALIRLNDTVTITGETLRGILGGRGVGIESARVPHDPDGWKWEIAERMPGGGEAERKTARALGVTPADVISAAYRLWKRPLTDERDRIVTERDPDASPDRRRALRGQVTRTLVEQLTAEIGKGS